MTDGGRVAGDGGVGDAEAHARGQEGGERGARRTVVGYRLGTVRARTLDVSVGDFYDFAAT